MELKEAVERLLETRDRHAKNIKMLEESKVYVKNTAFEEVLIERRKDVEAIDTVLAELDKQKQVKAEMRKVAWEEGYNQGYLAGAMESI
jgi:hypothetical protein